jgi:hypothetical protein
MLFVTSDLAIPQVNGNLAKSNPFVGISGETFRTDTQQKRPEDPEEGWTFVGKKKNMECPSGSTPLAKTQIKHTSSPPNQFPRQEEREGKLTLSYTTLILNLWESQYLEDRNFAKHGFG